MSKSQSKIVVGQSRVAGSNLSTAKQYRGLVSWTYLLATLLAGWFGSMPAIAESAERFTVLVEDDFSAANDVKALAGLETMTGNRFWLESSAIADEGLRKGLVDYSLLQSNGQIFNGYGYPAIGYLDIEDVEMKAIVIDAKLYLNYPNPEGWIGIGFTTEKGAYMDVPGSFGIIVRMRPDGGYYWQIIADGYLGPNDATGSITAEATTALRLVYRKEKNTVELSVNGQIVLSDYVLENSASEFVPGKLLGAGVQFTGSAAGSGNAVGDFSLSIMQ